MATTRLMPLHTGSRRTTEIAIADIMHKLKQKYRLFDEDKALPEEFLQTLIRDPNTSYGYSWVIRRYLSQTKINT